MAVIRARKLITDADIPAAIARDEETAAAINAHVSILHPLPAPGFGQSVSTENVFNSGCGFLDCRQGGGVFPPNMSHIQGFQARFNHSGGNWGMQMVTQNNIDNECYFRIVTWNIWKPWRRIWNDGNFDPNNYLLQSEGNGRYRQISVPLTNADIPTEIARDVEVSAAINFHTNAANPHPQYPQFKRAIFIVNCPSSQSATAFIPHNLVPSTIRSFTAFALVYGGSISEIRIPPGGAVAPWIGQSFYYTVDIGPTNINIRTSTNSNTVFGAPVTIVVDYV